MYRAPHGRERSRRRSHDARCFVPPFDGAFLSSDSRDALWTSTGGRHNGLDGGAGARLGRRCPASDREPLPQPGRPACAGDQGALLLGQRGVEMQREWPNVRAQLGDEVLRAKGASASDSDGGTRLSFPSTDLGREVFQPNAVVGICHRRASHPARLVPALLNAGLHARLLRVHPGRSCPYLASMRRS